MAVAKIEVLAVSVELIHDCRLIKFEVKGDERGQLIAIESGRNVPFEIKRTYFIFGTQAGVRRGFHAHRRLWQLATCVAGGCRMLLDDGIEQREVLLDRPDKGLLIAPMVWHEMHDFTPDCVMLVLADDYYDEADYIRSLDEFRKLAARD